MGADQEVINHSTRYAHPGPPFIKNRSDGRFCITTPIYDANNNKGKAKFVTPSSPSSYELDLAMVHRPLSTPFDSEYLKRDTLTNPSSTTPYSSWEIPSSKARYPSSALSPRTCKKFDKRSSTPKVQSGTPNKSRCWPLARSPPPDKPWTRPSIASSRLELTAPSTLFYFDKPFGMWATTKLWSTSGTTSTANYKRADDRLHRRYPVRILRLPTSPGYWRDSATHRCVTCTRSPSSKTEETTTGTTSEVAVFTP